MTPSIFSSLLPTRAEHSAPETSVATAFSTLQKLASSGVNVPDEVAEPIIEAHAASNPASMSDQGKQRVQSAIHRLESGAKYWTDTRRQYSRWFYFVLAGLLVFQLFAAAATDILKNLTDSQAQLHTSLASTGDNKSKASPDMITKRDTYLAAGEYLTLIPVKIVGILPFVRELLPPLRKEVDPATIEKNQAINDGRTETTLIVLRLLTSFLGAYVLPLLYGMLGAVAFILRKISAAAETGKGDLGRLRRSLDLRLPVGALSGLAAGWLLQPSTLPGTSLSPLALAFVAGYAAELVFAAMDRLVAAFSTDASARPQDQSASSKSNSRGTVSDDNKAKRKDPSGDPPSEPFEQDDDSASSDDRPTQSATDRGDSGGTTAVNQDITPTSKARANEDKEGQ